MSKSTPLQPQALPPEPGTKPTGELDEAEARKWLADNDWDYQKYGDRRPDRSAYDTMMRYEISDLLEWAFLAGARSRDAILASRGERIKELENVLGTHRALLKEICEQWNEDCDHACDRHAHSSGCKSVDIANAKRALHSERDTLHAALEQVKAERDELKRLHDIEAVRVDITARDALKARIASLEEGLRMIASFCPEGHISIVPQKALQQATNIARALLAAGEKAGGENEG